MNHCRAVSVPIMMILGPSPFHMPRRKIQGETEISYNKSCAFTLYHLGRRMGQALVKCQHLIMEWGEVGGGCVKGWLFPVTDALGLKQSHWVRPQIFPKCCCELSLKTWPLFDNWLHR